MKVLMIGLAASFTENLNYQDNLLSKAFTEQGHEVIYISNTDKYENGHLVQTEEQDYIYDGLRLIRIKYKKIFGRFISSKIRSVKGLKNIIEEIKPDLIFHHGLQSYEMITIARYIKNNPTVSFVVDSHEDYNNSATKMLSKHILHKIFYKYIIKKVYKYIDKIYYVTSESKQFLNEVYKLPDDKMVFLPLGGTILDEDSYVKIRQSTREKYNINQNEVVFLHTGKINKLKKTEELIDAFNKVSSDKGRLLIAGKFDSDLETDLMSKISSNSRISYLGWQTGADIMKLISACDVYVQPGSQSATLQNAACLRCALIMSKHPSYELLFGNNVMYAENSNQIKIMIEKLIDDPLYLNIQKESAFHIARKYLDYNNQVLEIIRHYKEGTNL